MKFTQAISVALALICASFAGASISASPSVPPYRAEPAVTLSDGRWDLVSFDAEHHRVIIARGDTVSVVDTVAGTERSIGTVSHGHAALAIPGGNLIAVTSGGDDSVRLLQVDTGQEHARTTVGKDPDAMIWDPASARLVVMNAKGGTISVVDPVTAQVERTINVKPGLELAAMVGPHLLAVNNEDANELELVDLARGTMLPAIALAGCEGPTGLAYDPSTGLALSACANGKAALIDVGARKLLRLVPIGAGPDTVLVDARRHRFLIPCGKSGTLNVITMGRRAMVAMQEVMPTETGARSGAIDPVTGKVYLPSAGFKPSESGKRPEIVTGSVHLIVLSPVR
jgi:YVTN family beta-propeller protein